MSTLMPTIMPASGNAALSLQQLRLWLECQTDTGNAAYQMPSAVLVTGKIETGEFAAAVQAVIRHHTILQCRFTESLGTVKHIADQQVQPEIIHLDIAAEQQGDLQHYIEHWCGQNLNLQNGPLLRVQLAELRYSDTPQYLLLLNIHHLLTDGWSNRLLLQEILQQYHNPGTTPSTGQADYFAYIRWQQAQWQQGVLAEQLQFWQQELQGVEAITLPVMRDNDNATLPVPALADVSQSARQFQVTPFAVYLAAWLLTLHKLTQQPCFAVITPFANRQREEFFSTIGLLANALPIVGDFTRPQTLQDLLRNTHSRLQMANINSEVPLAGIAGQFIQNRKDTNNGDLALLFTAAINYETSPLQQLIQDAGLTLELLPLPTAPTKFPLTLNIRHNSPTRTGTQFSIEYDSDQFSAGFIRRLEMYYTRAVQALVKTPTLNVREFSLLDQAEQLALLGLAHCADALLNHLGNTNRTLYSLPAITHLHTLIEQQCLATPEAIAVSCENYRISYAELERQASRISHYLHHEYGSGGIIGISLPRSSLVSVALLGILKSGNAYLPLDAQFPPARLQQMTDEAQPACIIISAEYRKVFEKNLPCLLIEDMSWQKETGVNTFTPTPPGTGNPLFNVIYTSGSTGKPKGVRVLQRGIINRLLWMQAQYTLAANDVVLQKTPLTFDVSVWELFWPLMVGARLHYAKPEGHRDADYLRELIDEQHISTVHFVPSMLDIFLEQAERNALPSLQRVFCSGETLHHRQVNRFRENFPDVALHNLYGPTEASVDVSYFDAASTARQYTAVSTPIGQPIWNTQLHILDDTLRPVPPGCIAELYIGGLGLADGYQGNAALTAERFIDNPWYLDDHPSARLYKTGDLARYLPDGNIEFIGRNDLQVKLRGLRIELMDIEQQALQQAGIRRAAAMAKDGQLLLFYQGDIHLDHTEWRELLGQQLPEWMLPNAFISIAEWPLTGSGKTDRKALAAQYQPLSEYRQAQTATGQQVQALWEAGFGKPVSTTTNFFEAGGHSLLAMQLIAQLAQAFRVNLHFRDIYTYATISDLAAYIDSLPADSAVSIPVAASAKQYPASFQQQRLFLFQQLFPQSTAYNMPAAFVLQGNVDIPALEQALRVLLQRHAILRTVYTVSDDRIWQMPLEDYDFKLDFTELSSTELSSTELFCTELAFTTTDIKNLANRHGQQVFDLQHELPLRAAIFKLAEGNYLFCFCLHHIAGDALTLEIIARELAAVYTALVQEKSLSPLTLPEPALQYHDFSCWQQQQATQQKWLDDLQWWQQDLANAPELLAIPHDRPRTALQSDSGAQYLQEIDSALVENLLAFCRAQQLTPFMVLLSCLQVFLGKLARQEDVCVGVPVAGRDHPGLATLAGFFVNSIILRSRQQANPGFLELLQEQKHHILAAFAHQDIPIENVLASLGFTRNTHHNPVAQVGFNFLQDNGTELLSLTLPGLAVTPVQAPVNTAKYEMTWIFYRNSAGLRLAIEYNTGLFDASTIAQWAGYFQTLLRNALAAPDTPLQQLACLEETETRRLLEQDFSPLEKCYPLTATQRDIYLDSLMFPHKRHNQLGFLTHSTTALDISVWRNVLQDLYNHTDSLRARIVRTRHPLLDVAWQVIAPAGELPQSCFSYIHHGEQALDDTGKQQAIDQALFSPYSETNPLWRVHIHEFTGQHYLFILAAHHAMFDGVSIQMLGRMIKGNYQKHLEGSAPGYPATGYPETDYPEMDYPEMDYPANNYADYVQQHGLSCDRASTWHYWQQQSAHLQPYLDFRPLLTGQPDSFASIEQQLDNADWQALQALCKSWRTSPPLFFKAIFALAIKAWHRMEGNFCFTEVVLGRDKAFYTTQGLFFEQQPNIINSHVIKPDNTLPELLVALRQYRKDIAQYTPISLRLQHRLLPVPVPYLFNFYIMESATPFFGKMERIEHLMPEMDHAVNCIVKVIDDQLHLQLMFNRSELEGEAFLALLVDVTRQCLQGKTLIADLLPGNLPATTAQRFRLSLPASNKLQEKSAVTLASSSSRKPANVIEEQILTVWQEVLGRQDIGVDDNFFELGGHSLHAMRIASRLREQYTVELPLAEIFNTPTIAAIAGYLHQAHEQQQPLASMSLPPLRKVTGSDYYPLSHAQKRVWFLTRIDEANMAYNMPAALKLDGPLDKAALRQALHTVLERHTLLRSVIDNSTGIPQWHTQPADHITLEEITCTADIASTQDWLQQQVNSEARQPFIIDHQPLVRLKLVTLAPQQHVLLLTLHHLVGDAQSLFILAREVAVLYTAFHQQQTNPLPTLPIQYSDYTLWQQALLDSDILRQQLDYWKTELDLAPVLLGLPIDRPRPSLQTFNGAQLGFVIPADLTKSLRQLARENNVTLFMLLLGSYQLLLSRLCHQHDVCVGIPRDGRFSRELEPLAGFFINALVIRTRLDANYSLTELLAQVRQKTLQAFAHELVPAEMVMQALHIERQLQFMPIVQAAFNYLNSNEVPSAMNMGDLQVSFIEPDIITAKFDVLLTVTDHDEQLHAGFEYNTDLFDASTLERFRDGWLYLLRLICANPEAHIDQLYLPGEKPVEEILCLQGVPAKTAFDFLKAVSQQAQGHPDAVAVICGRQQSSYRQLESQSNVIAQKLISLGVKPGDRVAVCLGRRVELLPAILGTIKSGACYVPMDSHYPPERLAYMLADSKASVLITDKNCDPKNRAQGKLFSAKVYPEPTFYTMDIDALDLSMVTPAPHVVITPDSLLYIIYTSGSTGLPKGAAVYHRSEASLLAWYTEEFGFTANDKTLVMSSIGFDLTQKNLLALLTVGGTVVLPATDHYDVHALLDCIAEHAITTLNCAPSAFYPLVESGEPGLSKLQSLRTVLLGGEPIHVNRLAPWTTSPAFDCSIVNMYGPTECTDISTFYTLPASAVADILLTDYTFPLGKPSAGVSLYILNESLQPVPNGLTGELCIAGSSVGAGYWQQPELTAGVFVPNPFTTGDHDRVLYRTGDLARLNPGDGLLYYIGRKDFQIKLRGLRIEPGEIEHALRLLPAVNDAVVLADNAQLLAFVSSHVTGFSQTISGWREALQGHLPEHMIPQLLIPVSTWPLTPHGKIDRVALLALPRPDTASHYVAPRSDLEKDIAQIWEDILGTGKAGIFDNFFEAGGDSLAALRLLAALENRFATRLPMASLFGAQTIAQLAHVISNKISDWSPIVPIQSLSIEPLSIEPLSIESRLIGQQGSKTPIFAVHALGAQVLAYEPLARALGKDQPFYGLQAYGLEEGQTPYSDLNLLLEFYVSAIRQQQPQGPYQIIGHSFGGILAIELARKLQQQGEIVRFVALLDTHMPGRYSEAMVDDAQIASLVNEQFHGLVAADFTHRAIAVIRGFQAMMAGFKIQPLSGIPLLLFTPQDLATQAKGLGLNILSGRHIKTRGLQKISADIRVIAVPGDHYSMLKVSAGDVLPATLQEIIHLAQASAADGDKR